MRKSTLCAADRNSSAKYIEYGYIEFFGLEI